LVECFSYKETVVGSNPALPKLLISFFYLYFDDFTSS
jgi:hypothetical protein